MSDDERWDAEVVIGESGPELLPITRGTGPRIEAWRYDIEGVAAGVPYSIAVRLPLPWIAIDPTDPETLAALAEAEHDAFCGPEKCQLRDVHRRTAAAILPAFVARLRAIGRLGA